MELKTINEINQNFSASLTAKQNNRQTAQNPGKIIVRVISDMLFYLVIIIVLYSVLSLDIDAGNGRSVMGISCFTVMSSSMRDEIPKGSLIIVRRTNPMKLKTGDNITFKSTGDTTVTHKIIDIIDAEPLSSTRRFQTKGTNNTYPDSETVGEADIIGKVIIIFPGAGTQISRVGESIHIILFIFLGCSLLSFILRITAGKAGQKCCGKRFQHAQKAANHLEVSP